ncbi:MAG TPA: aminotransferase class IV [bacterium]|nr:aminotransferase class IV [bacterium]
MSDGRRWVFWEGGIIPAAEARVPVLDAGFLYGDGIYETMRSYAGHCFAMDRHLARLERSARGVRLPLPPADSLRRALLDTVHANGGGEGIVRLTITRGVLARRLDLSSAGPPSVLVTFDPIDPRDDEMRAAGIRVITSSYRRFSSHALAGIKSTNYQISLFARNEAREAGAQEVLMRNETGDYVESAAANLFLVEAGTIVTPPPGSGILGGVTRGIVLERVAAAGMAAVEESIAPARLERADEIFLSGTTIRVAPVVGVDGRPVGDGSPGPVSRQLLRAYLDAVEEEQRAAG